MLRKIIASCFFCLNLFANSQQPILNQNLPIEEDFFLTPTHEKIAFFYLKPPGKGPFATIYLVHGSQPNNPDIGAKQLVDAGYLQKFQNEGILAVAISMPGYGQSTGHRDFAGPDSQKAIAAIIEHFSHLSFVNPDKMGIYGISKGAILCSMVHSYYPNLKFQILEAGSYDLVTRLTQLPSYLKGIKDAIIQEAGDSQEALKARSAIYYTQNVHANSLILHGEIDDRRGLFSAKQLHELLLSEAKTSELKIFPKMPHRLPEEKWDTIIPFVRQQFFELYGIGIKLFQTNPAIQIVDIPSESQAALTGKLKIGDIILKISPNNDATEINVLRMPIHQFTTLILGKKDTYLRLHVQHFDQTCEDIVIKRG